MDCIFCKIISGEIKARKIYEDDDVLAFLDVNPVSEGHTLIIPKKHFKDIEEIDDELLMKIQIVAKKLIKDYKEKLDIEGLTLVQNNGYGQDVKHYHLHLIPRYKEDNLHMEHRKCEIDLDEVYKKIAAN